MKHSRLSVLFVLVITLSGSALAESFYTRAKDVVPGDDVSESSCAAQFSGLTAAFSAEEDRINGLGGSVIERVITGCKTSWKTTTNSIHGSKGSKFYSASGTIKYTLPESSLAKEFPTQE